jgi:multidrug efflux system membrane fusion protein
MKPRAALALVLLAAVGAGGCTRSSAAHSAAPAVPVTTSEARLADVPDRIDAVGTVEPLETVSVKAQAAGQIVAVRFTEGQQVRAGDLLFQIDPRPYQSALAQAEANLARDRAQADKASADARRAEDLFKQGVLSKDQQDQAVSVAQSQRATVAADAAAVENTRLSLAYTEIRSPIGGRTGSVLVHEGNVVKAIDGNPLVIINRIDPIYVSFAVPEKRLGAIRAAQSRHSLAVEALAAGDAAAPPTGRLSFVDNQVDTLSGTIRLKATFPNADGRLWPGQFVTARLSLGTRSGVVVVPAAAVQAGQQGSFVFVVKPDLTVEQRPVVAEAAETELAVIDQGVRAGETVVVDGQMNLTAGTRVEPRADAAAAAPVATASVAAAGTERGRP